MSKAIIEFCGIDETLFTTFLDSYQMIDWEMNWEQFLTQAQKEINEKIEQWKQEKIYEEEEG